MPDRFTRPHRSWLKKFADAWRGVVVGMRGQASFVVHAIAAVVVVILAVLLEMSAVQWSLLLLCIAMVFVAELFNSAIEHLARAIDDCVNSRLRDALDIASGAVLMAAIGAVIVGGIVFAARLWGG